MLLRWGGRIGAGHIRRRRQLLIIHFRVSLSVYLLLIVTRASSFSFTFRPNCGLLPYAGSLYLFHSRSQHARSLTAVLEEPLEFRQKIDQNARVYTEFVLCVCVCTLCAVSRVPMWRFAVDHFHFHSFSCVCNASTSVSLQSAHTTMRVGRLVESRFVIIFIVMRQSDYISQSLAPKKKKKMLIFG